MFVPSLASWIEQRNYLVSFWVHGFCLICFVPIADGAGQPKVEFFVCSPFGQRNNVLNFQARHDQMLWAEAVTTTMTGRFADFLPDLFWNM